MSNLAANISEHLGASDIYAVVPGDVILKKNLTGDAFFLYCRLLLEPANQPIDMAAIQEQYEWGDTKFQTMLKLLQSHGHIVKSDPQRERGKFAPSVYRVIRFPTQIELHSIDGLDIPPQDTVSAKTVTVDAGTVDAGTVEGARTHADTNPHADLKALKDSNINSIEHELILGGQAAIENPPTLNPEKKKRQSPKPKPQLVMFSEIDGCWDTERCEFIDPRYFYIGSGNAERNQKRSKYANPLSLKYEKKDELVQIDRAPEYRKWLREHYSLITDLADLPDGVILVCDCEDPHMCHGRVLQQYIVKPPSPLEAKAPRELFVPMCLALAKQDGYTAPEWGNPENVETWKTVTNLAEIRKAASALVLGKFAASDVTLIAARFKQKFPDSEVTPSAIAKWAGKWRNERNDQLASVKQALAPSASDKRIDTTPTPPDDDKPRDVRVYANDGVCLGWYNDLAREAARNNEQTDVWIEKRKEKHLQNQEQYTQAQALLAAFNAAMLASSRQTDIVSPRNLDIARGLAGKRITVDVLTACVKHKLARRGMDSPYRFSYLEADLPEFIASQPAVYQSEAYQPAQPLAMPDESSPEYQAGREEITRMIAARRNGNGGGDSE